MAASHLAVELLNDLKNEVALNAVDVDAQIVLTPYLTLACGLLYMVASDGDLGVAESSHLQSVLGGDELVLQYALRYVQSVPLAQFFSDAPEVLSTKDKWCILTNVCDALLSDGRADSEELELFAQMRQAFGIEREQFEPYFKILALKNDKQVLGRFAGVKNERQPMTPHFALAISLLYMLTADGSIGRQEVGQLEAVIGEFSGLQNVALTYVRSVKLKQFLEEASTLLTPDQKLYILVNVCDSMLSDGAVARLEDKVFLSMLTAFDYSEKTFEIYLRVLETKCFKPFDTSKFVNGVAHNRSTGAPKEEGVLFENQQTTRSASALISAEASAAAVNQAVGSGSTDESAMGAFISRTMADNIQSVSDSFENQAHVIQVAQNATDALNLQKVDGATSSANNRQVVGSEMTGLDRQRVDATSVDGNLQKIDQGSVIDHHELLESSQGSLNVQTIDLDAVPPNRVQIEAQAQVKNIQEVVEDVHERLDKFERDHLGFLQIGRAQRFDDSFALLEEDTSADNWQMLDASFARLGFSRIGASDELNPQRSMGAKNLQSNSTAVTGAQDCLSRSSPQSASSADLASSMPGGAAADLQIKVGYSNSQRIQGRASLLKRIAKLSYAKLLFGCAAVAFAAPIDVQSPFRRVVAGPLVVIPSTSDDLMHRFPSQHLGQAGLAVQLD